MYNRYKRLNLVIDDEKYIGWTGCQMSGIRNFYSSDHDKTPISLATYSNNKNRAKSRVVDSYFFQKQGWLWCLQLEMAKKDCKICTDVESDIS